MRNILSFYVCTRNLTFVKHKMVSPVKNLKEGEAMLNNEEIDTFDKMMDMKTIILLFRTGCDGFSGQKDLRKIQNNVAQHVMNSRHMRLINVFLLLVQPMS